MARKKRKKGRHIGDVRHPEMHVLDRLYVLIASCKGADPETSYSARLFKRGRVQIAKKLGEEAVETLIEGIRGNRSKLIAESADMLHYLLTLWAATNVKPKAIWNELAQREGLFAPGKK